MEKETDADYDLKINLNNVQIESFSFDKSTILDQISKQN